MTRRTDILAGMKAAEHDRLMSEFKNIFMNKARWEGMPDDIPDDRPMEPLWYSEFVTFFKNEALDSFYCLPAAIEGIDTYGEPARWKPVAQGDKAGVLSAMELSHENSVLIWCCSSHVAPSRFIMNVVDQMVNVEFTKRLNINAQKMPINVISSDKKVLSDLNVMQEFLEAKPSIITDHNVSDRLEVVNLGVPYLGSEMDDTYNTYYRRVLNYLGINNSDIDKKERMITSEAAMMDEHISLIHESYMRCWKKGAEDINKMFGLSVKVVDTYEEIAPEEEDEEDAA